MKGGANSQKCRLPILPSPRPARSLVYCYWYPSVGRGRDCATLVSVDPRRWAGFVALVKCNWAIRSGGRDYSCSGQIALAMVVDLWVKGAGLCVEEKQENVSEVQKVMSAISER